MDVHMTSLCGKLQTIKADDELVIQTCSMEHYKLDFFNT